MLDRTKDVAETGVAAEELKQFFERIERLNEEKAAINADISDIYKEAKGRGYDTAAMKVVVRRRAMDPTKRMELDTVVELYEQSAGLS